MAGLQLQGLFHHNASHTSLPAMFQRHLLCQYALSYDFKTAILEAYHLMAPDARRMMKTECKDIHRSVDSTLVLPDRTPPSPSLWLIRMWNRI